MGPQNVRNHLKLNQETIIDHLLTIDDPALVVFDSGNQKVQFLVLTLKVSLLLVDHVKPLT